MNLKSFNRVLVALLTAVFLSCALGVRPGHNAEYA